MSAETNALDYIRAFRCWLGNPEITRAEAELRDLAALRDAVEYEIGIHAHEVATYEGISWATIADALSLSPAAARRRYAR